MKKSKRSKNIPQKIRKQVQERDRFTCQRCGRWTNSIHHIVSSGMGRRKYHAVENLIMLCPRCHALAHASKEVEKWCFEWSRQHYGYKIDEIYKKVKGF